jgi:Holliday junction resolvase RusA-like endonuclease
MARRWSGVIVGQPASKANRRRVVINPRTGRRMLNKSPEACAYADAVARQVPVLARLLEGRLRVTAIAYYRDARSDLDLSVLFDALQKRVFKNDRQLREMHLSHAIDASAPRVVIEIAEIADECDKPINGNPLPGRLP